MDYINIDPEDFKRQDTGGSSSKGSKKSKKRTAENEVHSDESTDRGYSDENTGRGYSDENTGRGRSGGGSSDNRWSSPGRNTYNRNRNNGTGGSGVTFHLPWKAILFIIIGAIIIFWLFFNKGCESSPVSVSVERNDTIDNTPQVITAMKAIGQWEFLAITDEELVDTVRKGIFSDDELVRIYYGTVRLGTDLSKISDDAIKRQGDSIYVTIPKIKLLDKEFIDEARTEAFFEKGKWSDKDKAKLYYKAHRMMKNRCLTKANLQTANDNARQQIENFFRSMGFNYVEIEFK